MSQPRPFTRLNFPSQLGDGRRPHLWVP
jgi:hypothetical protein